MQTLVLRIPDQLAADLEAEAKRLNITKSEVARRRLLEGASDAKTEGTKPSLWSRMQHLVIRDDDSPTDLGANPEHLKGYGEHGSHH
jgi:hypothetical protein